MNAVTIEFPAISSQVIADLNETETILAATELDFVRALREKYGSLAQYNGNIKIANYSRSDSNCSIDRELFHRTDGALTKGLLAIDNFGSDDTDQNSGTYDGSRLYLLASTRGLDGARGWLRIDREGSWSRWQGSPNWWGCGISADTNEGDYEEPGGSISFLSDEQVAAQYRMDALAEQLAETLTTLAAKLPERLARKRALAAGLAAAVANLGGK